VIDQYSVDTVIGAYRRAQVNKASIENYLTQLTASIKAIDSKCITEWEEQIKEAEKCRLLDPKALNILSTHGVPEDLTLLAEPSDIQGTAPQTLEEWLMFGLRIEWRQWVSPSSGILLTTFDQGLNSVGKLRVTQCHHPWRSLHLLQSLK